MRVRVAVRAAIPIVWAAAMAAARWLDPWLAIGLAAAIMAAAVLATDGALIRRLVRPSMRSFVLGVTAAAAMIATTELLFPLSAASILMFGEKTAEIYARFLSGRATLAIIACIVPLVVAEEILWRGAFQESVQAQSQTVTVLISATVYAAAHAPFGSTLLVAVAFVCGIYWSALRGFSGNLFPSLIAHLAWDMALILVPLTSHSALR